MSNFHSSLNSESRVSSGPPTWLHHQSSLPSQGLESPRGTADSGPPGRVWNSPCGSIKNLPVVLLLSFRCGVGIPNVFPSGVSGTPNILIVLSSNLLLKIFLLLSLGFILCSDGVENSKSLGKILSPLLKKSDKLYMCIQLFLLVCKIHHLLLLSVCPGMLLIEIHL